LRKDGSDRNRLSYHATAPSKRSSECEILRRYVTEQHGFPVTRQTSVEFLNALTKTSQFSSDEKSLLEDFLNRCDLIKFARYEATSADSELLLEEATRFVKGGQLATV
jgi:hypothetical protein